MSSYASRLQKVIEFMRRHPQVSQRVGYAIADRVLEHSQSFIVSNKSNLLYILGRNPPREPREQQLVNRLIVDIERNFDQVDEGAVIQLNRAFAKFDSEHKESSRAFHTLNQNVISQIRERQEAVEDLFLTKYIASFARSLKHISPNDLKTLGSVLNEKIKANEGVSQPFRHIREIGAAIFVTRGAHEELNKVFINALKATPTLRVFNQNFIGLIDFLASLNKLP